ncbi:probable nucleoredoxin 3 [Macadamia integrifolia]|uniref:probable nucleoredoxin 3 n=1 Tax=Macadamia integrifolia TaxID=60698 RepID=UPI001C4F6CDE|nr:probable nucleoredoxin 3 [Macadamia integrifolia]XP_042492001.1 probable nucleoredoxin 3 [Macadamia integrifolia]XP_042492002.1 probable nucleoredoxin 3 [Macadamia integrifolia]
MAGGEYGTENINGSTTSTSILAAEGVEILLSAEGKVPLSSLDQKKICLFFSANWCRPCRAFIPQLVQLYNTLRNTERNLEIIFVSFDRDENGFREHFKLMPWLAVPFDISIRRQLCNHYHVVRIPSLIPLNPNGESVGEDAVKLIEDYGIDAFPFNRERREELEAMDKMKRQGGKLEDLLLSGARDYVVSGDGRKVLVSELVDKTIGLYFAAHWCPPCRAFTIQLKEAYNELKSSQNRSFEIIFISTDRDPEEFNLHITNMPWLAIPYNDKTQQDLCRIFDIKGIPALVLLGPDGKTLSTNGRALISSYGSKAFPFTESRRDEVEAALRKEVDGLPHQVKDPKHEHVLRLDMAKAYVCDFCKGQGRFWVFSCDKCDFDLHPSCLD